MKAKVITHRDRFFIGYRIADLRRDSELTQIEFSKKYGVQRRQVIRWELGENLPRMEILKQMAKDFNTTVEWILYDEGDKDV